MANSELKKNLEKVGDQNQYQSSIQSKSLTLISCSKSPEAIPIKTKPSHRLKLAVSVHEPSSEHEIQVSDSCILSLKSLHICVCCLIQNIFAIFNFILMASNVIPEPRVSKLCFQAFLVQVQSRQTMAIFVLREERRSH